MPLNSSQQALLNQVQAALGPAISPSLTAASAANDVFEAYVLGLILEAGRRETATVSYEDVTGATPAVFTFRTSPGFIFSRNQNYTHAIITFSRKPPLEAHLGIYVEGASGVLHECDVAVLNRVEAQACRASQASPRSTKLLIATECKFYAATPSLGLGRGFLGLTDDITARDCFFVMNRTAPSIERLLARRRRHMCRESIIPANPGDVELLMNSFRSAFREYKRS
jgi:hypothetical protein